MTVVLRSLSVLLSSLFAAVAVASTSGVVVSQVYGGGGNAGSIFRNDFIELFNAGAAPVSLAGWSVQYASAAGTTWSVTPLTPVTLAPGQYYLVQQAVGTNPSAPLPTPDATGTIAMSATTGKVALVSATAALAGGTPDDPRIVDLVGFGGAAFSEGMPTAAPGNPTAVVRLAAGCTDTDRNSDDFTVATPTPRNGATALAPCGVVVNAPIATSCPAVMVPAGLAGSGLVTATDADGIVDAVALVGNPTGLSLGGFTPATAVGGTATASISVAATVPGGSYPVTLNWANNQSQTATCTITVTVGAITSIPSIQGRGDLSPMAGRAVVTQGVVTRATNNGFYLQDPDGDGDPLTSDGLLVFTGTVPTVVAGDLVRVAGTVAEFNTGSAANVDTRTHTVTELASVTSVTVLGRGYSIAPLAITLPTGSRDELERYEGMLVTVAGPLTVSQNFFQGRFGQVTLSSLGRLETPTNRLRPGPGALALAEDNRRRAIVLEDGTSAQNPNPPPFLGEANTLRAGDTVASVTGVLDYGLATASNADPGSWRIVAVGTPVFTRANPRPVDLGELGGAVRVAGFNVLNFFTTFTNGQTVDGAAGRGCTLGATTSASNCRGADNAAEFLRQRTKIVEALAVIDADAVGLMEMQNDGAALAHLVAALNARLGAGTYAAVSDPLEGTGTDAIKVAMIYKPGRLSLGGRSVSDPSAVHNRPPLAQTFVVPGGQRFTMIVNHFKSKGCDGATGVDTDQADLQGCFNATRLAQARALRRFASGLFPAGPLPNVVLLGDFNAYAQEDPIVELTGNGFVDEIGRTSARLGTVGYSYVFDGAAGRLDHALVSQALSSRVKRAIEWHINADEPVLLDYNLENKPTDFYTPTPYRASDHDPVVIGLQLRVGSDAVPAKAGSEGR